MKKSPSVKEKEINEEAVKQVMRHKKSMFALWQVEHSEVPKKNAKF